MTPSMPEDTRRAERPAVIAVHVLPGQARPFCVTALRPLAVVAVEALAAADTLLARDGARLAVLDGGGVLLQGVTS